MALADVVVEHGAGDFAFLNHFLHFVQRVNAHEVDVLANGAASVNDRLISAQRHRVVVAEDNVNIVAELRQRGRRQFLTLGLIPVAALLVQLVGLQASVFKRLDGELGAVLRVNVLRVAHDHHIIDNAVAVEVAVVLGLGNDFALEGAGLTSIGANVANLVRELHVFLARLTVDEHNRDAGGVGLLNDGRGGRALHEVQNHNVNIVGDEAVNLVGLLGLIVLAVHHGDVLSRDAAVFGQITNQLSAIQGHEVVGKLINRNADLRSRLLSSRHAANHNDEQSHHQSKNLFHGKHLFLLFQRESSR